MQTQKKANQTILHATDLRPEGGTAFEHGVALARELKARLVSVHASAPDADTRAMPAATTLLERWGDESEVDHETIEHVCCEDPIDTLLDVMHSVDHDLIVVGSHQRKGVERLVSGSVSESVILNSKKPVLVVPVGKPGFVEDASGKVTIDKIVVPAKSHEELQAVQAALMRHVPDVKNRKLDLYVVVVGDAEGVGASQMSTPDGARWTWHTLHKNGKLAESISEAVDEVGADLLAMATQGQNSLLDTVVGTNTLQAMRTTDVPLLVVPFE